ncbi:hypothetical protein ACFORO_23100 [Amycolatopsis halotolerans]|uniref:Uncharacterized protein n=1 Tax=Amycolatopsis halotolerans TaxID=330083 RepID=A0ABV7QIB2_9PSEU
MLEHPGSVGVDLGVPGDRAAEYGLHTEVEPAVPTEQRTDPHAAPPEYVEPVKTRACARRRRRPVACVVSSLLFIESPEVFSVWT